MTAAPTLLDFAPLEDPVGRWDAAYLADQVKARPAYAHWHLGRTGLGWAVAGLVLLLAAGTALLVAYRIGEWMPALTVLFWSGLALVAVAYASLAVTVVQGFGAAQRVRALAHLIRFTNRNRLEFEPIAPNREYPGPRFAGLYLRDRVADPAGGFEYGQRLQSGRHGAQSGAAVGWYLALPLRHPVPSASLTAHGRRPLGEGETIALEGEFADRFTLRCMPGVEDAARQIFTPEARALLVDGRASCDVELVDRWLLVYPRRSTALRAYGDVAFHRRLLRLVTVLGAAEPVRTPAHAVAEGDSGRLVEPWSRRLMAPALTAAVLLPAVVAAAVVIAVVA